jgi:hypothetical protein
MRGLLRQSVAAAVAEEASARSAAGRFGVSVSPAISLGAALAAKHHSNARPKGLDHRSLPEKHRETVLELLAKPSDLT